MGLLDRIVSSRLPKNYVKWTWTIVGIFQGDSDTIDRDEDLADDNSTFEQKTSIFHPGETLKESDTNVDPLVKDAWKVPAYWIF